MSSNPSSLQQVIIMAIYM